DAHGLAPAIVIDQIVPVGNDVVDRTAGMTEWHAAIHAAGALFAQPALGHWLVDLEPVRNARRGRPAHRRFARVFEKTCDFTHAAPAPRPIPARPNPVRTAPPASAAPGLASALPCGIHADRF